MEYSVKHWLQNQLLTYPQLVVSICSPWNTIVIKHGNMGFSASKTGKGTEIANNSIRAISRALKK